MKLVVRRNGEVSLDGKRIGTWVDDPNDILLFTPDGASEPAVATVLRGQFRSDIIRWLEEQ